MLPGRGDRTGFARNAFGDPDSSDEAAGARLKPVAQLPLLHLHRNLQTLVSNTVAARTPSKALSGGPSQVKSRRLGFIT